VTFLTLEDETGVINVIVRQGVGQRHRPTLYGGRLVGVTGRVQRQERVVHVVAESLEDASGWLGRLDVSSRDFH
jgi:error-prone DNA polymerase